MMRLVVLAFRAMDRGLLEAASLLVPARRRREWCREWRSEMWHARKACGNSWRAEQEIVAFCLGAFQDAWCLRHDAPPVGGLPVSRTPVSWSGVSWTRGSWTRGSWNGSAAQYLVSLAAVLAAGYALALLLPEVRAARGPLRSAARPGTILIQEDGHYGPYKTALPFERYRVWSSGRHRYFDGFAFYRIIREKVSAGSEAPSGWQIADSSANLFALLGFPIQFARAAESADGNLPRVILSYTLWKNEFGGNPGIVGSLLRVGQRSAKIVGVAADRVWKLPGQPDAWLLESDAAIPAGRMGHVVAHLTRAGRSEMWAGRVNITVYNTDHSEQDYLGIAFDDPAPGPWDIYCFSIVLALLALPAITSVSLGEYGVSSHRPPWPRRMVRWGYLGAKFALLLPIVYFVPLDCAYWHASQHTAASEYAQLILSFSICLFGLRWALGDQRRRCPVCLKRVAHPAQVGLASRTFLAWNGTELMCTGGHTLLHVPGLPTSWFGTQQWLYLDASWEFLFAGTDAG